MSKQILNKRKTHKATPRVYKLNLALQNQNLFFKTSKELKGKFNNKQNYFKVFVFILIILEK